MMVGFKFRFFGDDAEVASKALGIVAHRDHSFMTASVPAFRLDFPVRRMVVAECKVGVVKQTETAAIKAALHGAGPFAIGLSSLYTKATFEAAAGLVGMIWFVWWIGRWAVEVKVKVGLVGVEVSTGDVVYGDFEDDALRSGLESVVLSLSPVEILLGELLTKQTRKLLAYAGPASNARLERASRECFEDGDALAELMSLYENLGEATRRLANEQDGETGETDRHLLGVEILTNNFDGTEKGTLFQVLNHTQTAFGVRLLRQGLSPPVL